MSLPPIIIAILGFIIFMPILFFVTFGYIFHKQECDTFFNNFYLSVRNIFFCVYCRKRPVRDTIQIIPNLPVRDTRQIQQIIPNLPISDIP